MEDVKRSKIKFVVLLLFINDLREKHCSGISIFHVPLCIAKLDKDFF